MIFFQRFHRRYFETLAVVIVLLFSTNPAFTQNQFCAIGNFGTPGPCFKALSMCESWVKESGGACVAKEIRESIATPDPFSDAYRLGRVLNWLPSSSFSFPELQLPPDIEPDRDTAVVSRTRYMRRVAYVSDYCHSRVKESIPKNPTELRAIEIFSFAAFKYNKEIESLSGAAQQKKRMEVVNSWKEKIESIRDHFFTTREGYLNEWNKDLPLDQIEKAYVGDAELDAETLRTARAEWELHGSLNLSVERFLAVEEVNLALRYPMETPWLHRARFTRKLTESCDVFSKELEKRLKDAFESR